MSAIYAIYTNPERVAAIWERFAVLAKHFPLYLVCSEKDSMHVPSNVVPLFCEFTSLETYKLLSKTTGLPRIRSHTKDTKEFMILMNAKTEFLKIASQRVAADHYVWLDAGLGHVFKDPEATYASILPYFELPLSKDRILIPGCLTETTHPFDQLLTRVNWRFSGGFFVVPVGMVDIFYHAVLAACEEIRYKSGLAIWEVNVWAYIESRLPIQWEYGNHNESIFNGIQKYQERVRA